MDMPGTYRRDACAPGSDHDIAGRKAAGWPAVVFRLRFCGVYLPAWHTRKRLNPAGLLVSTKVTDQWQVDLHPLTGDTEELINALTNASLLKRRDDCAVLLAGFEFDEGRLERWAQTWLCAPTEEIGLKALKGMDAWLTERYKDRARWGRRKAP